MATLQKIRSHGALVLIIVGAAMLAFIIGDFLNSGATYFSRSRETVAEIAGNKISITDFEKSINQLQEVYKIESGRQDIDENLSQQLRQQVWQEYLSKNAIESMAEAAGMRLTAKELTDQCIGSNPSSLITSRRAFADETGNYNRSVFMQFYQAVHSEDAQNNPQLQSYLNYWNYWETAIGAN
ncbi:MAG: SurA N-terminal domain-containing protein [Paludibacteraceae bacterium]|nr:SurA N-terminal domain-containing protein [Paludibacteraceae bacterium]